MTMAEGGIISRRRAARPFAVARAGMSLNQHSIFALVARASTQQPSWPVLIGLAFGAVLVLVVAYKLGKFLLRIAVGLVALAAVAALIWYFWLRQ